MGKRSIAILAPSAPVALAIVLLIQPRIIVIASSSMEPYLRPGDAAVIVRASPWEIGVGDVITYIKAVPFASTQVVTHRVVEANSQGELYIFRTKGDANPGPDGWDVTPQEVLGKVIIRIPHLGNILYQIKVNIVTIALITLGLGSIFIYKERGMGEAVKSSSPEGKPTSRGERDVEWEIGAVMSASCPT